MNTVARNPIRAWLEPLRPVLDPGKHLDWCRLADLESALTDIVEAHPVGPELAPGPERSQQLRAIRVQLAHAGLLDTVEHPALYSVLAQFLCGYWDIDLRDATGLGHGVLISRHGGEAVRQRWIPRLLAGELAGIAVTEPHGGSNPAATRTRAVARDGRWLISGRKTWISRLTEAAVFVTFFRAPDGQLAAAAVDASCPGLHRQLVPPVGLAGWAWGILELDAVPVQPDDVLDGDGMALLRLHFASYRPLVTATALGGAAAVFDSVATAVAARRDSGDIVRLRDSALVAIGKAHAQIVSSLLGVAAASRLSEIGHSRSEQWSAAMKAHGIDATNRAVAELALLLGADGFRADCHVAKVRRDLNGLQYADGIHDSLYRAAGKHSTAPSVGKEATLRILPALPESA